MEDIFHVNHLFSNILNLYKNFPGINYFLFTCTALEAGPFVIAIDFLCATYYPNLKYILIDLDNY